MGTVPFTQITLIGNHANLLLSAIQLPMSLWESLQIAYLNIYKKEECQLDTRLDQNVLPTKFTGSNLCYCLNFNVILEPCYGCGYMGKHIVAYYLKILCNFLMQSLQLKTAGSPHFM